MYLVCVNSSGCPVEDAPGLYVYSQRPSPNKRPLQKIKMSFWAPGGWNLVQDSYLNVERSFQVLLHYWFTCLKWLSWSVNRCDISLSDSVSAAVQLFWSWSVCRVWINGIVHPKNTILSSLTHSRLVLFSLVRDFFPCSDNDADSCCWDPKAS